MTCNGHDFCMAHKPAFFSQNGFNSSGLEKSGALAIAAALFGGCSVPVASGGKNLSFGYARRSHDATQVQTAIPGLDVRVGTGHDGLNLGWSSLVVAQPMNLASEPPNTESESGWTYAAPLGLKKRDSEGVGFVGWFYWTRPKVASSNALFVASGHGGVAFGVNSRSAAVDIGFGRQTWLTAPRDSSGVWRLSFESGLAGKTVLIKESVHEKNIPSHNGAGSGAD